MADWLNHVTIAAPRNGSTSHTVSPSSTNVGTTAIGTGVVAGAVTAGALFAPTALRFLLVVAEGSVTSTTPSGFTLPSGGSAVQNTGLYAWYKASAAGGDTLTTTHNGSNYPESFDIYEFPAGTTFAAAVSAVGVSPNGGAGPSVSGLTGTNWIAGAVGQAGSGATRSYTWNQGVEQADASAINSGTDGYGYSLTALDSSALTSASFAATFSGGAADTVERLVIAVKVPSGTSPSTVTLTPAAVTTTATTVTPTPGPTSVTLTPAVVATSAVAAIPTATVPAYVGIGAKSAGGTTGISIPVPSSSAAGDLLVAARAAWLGTATMQQPTGWTLGTNAQSGTGTAAGAHTTRAGVDWRQATASEPSAYAFPQAGSPSGVLGVMLRYAKDPSLYWDVVGVTGASGDTSHGTGRAGGATTGTVDVKPGDILVAVVGVDTDSDLGTVTATYSIAGGASRTLIRRTSGAGVTTGLAGNVEVFDRTVAETETGTVAFGMSTTVSQCGPAVFLRIRQVPAPSAVTLTPALASSSAVPVTPSGGAAPSTVELTPAAVASSGVVVSATPGPTTVTLAPAAAVASPVALTGTPGPTAVTLTAAALAAAAVAVTPTPGATQVSLTPAVAATQGTSITPTVGPTSVSLTPALASTTPVAVQATPSPTSVALVPAVVATQAVPVGSGAGTATVSLTAATITATARPTTPTSAPTTVTLTAATVTLTATFLQPAGGTITVALQAAVVTTTARPATPTAGPASVALQPATVATAGVPMSPSAAPLSVALTAVTVAAQGVALASGSAPTSVTLQAAVVQVQAAAVVPVVAGTLTVTLQAAFVSATAGPVVVALTDPPLLQLAARGRSGDRGQPVGLDSPAVAASGRPARLVAVGR